MTASRERVFWIDLLRIIACLMVIMIHAASSYFFDFDSAERHWWGNLYGSFSRAGVPLFLTISGLLLLPVRVPPAAFLKRRLGRVLFPLLVWGFLYPIFDSLARWADGSGGAPTLGTVAGAFGVLANFPMPGLHLWFLYVIVGLYLFMPIISPWLEQASRRDYLFFLSLWGVTLLMPFARHLFPLLWGEASWNGFGALFYFSGYLGYLVLAQYVKRFVPTPSPLQRLAALGFFAAVCLSTFGAQQLIYALKGRDLGILWDITSVNIALMVLSLSVAVKDFTVPSPSLRALAADLSEKSFGIFLIHYFIVYESLRFWDASGLPPALAMPLNAAATFGLSYLLASLLSLLPAKRYLIG